MSDPVDGEFRPDSPPPPGTKQWGGTWGEDGLWRHDSHEPFYPPNLTKEQQLKLAEITHKKGWERTMASLEELREVSEVMDPESKEDLDRIIGKFEMIRDRELVNDAKPEDFKEDQDG